MVKYQRIMYIWYLWNGINWSAIPGATSATFTPTASDEGMFVVAVVGGTNTNVSSHRVASDFVMISHLSSIQSVHINGTLRVGNTLSAHVIYNPPLVNPQVVFQWLSWNGSAWVNIPGATSHTFAPSAAFANTHIILRVTGTGINVTAHSRYSQYVLVASNLSNIRSVRIVGSPAVDSLLRADVELNPHINNPGLTFQWQLYVSGVGWTNIPGANYATFSPTSAHGGQFIRVRVAGTGINVSTTVRTASRVQIAGNPVNILNVTITGAPRLHETLSVSITYSGPVTNPDITIRWQRFRGGEWVALSGTRTLTLLDAHVGEFIRVVVSGEGTRVTEASVSSQVVTIMPRLDGPQVIETSAGHRFVDAFAAVTTPTAETAHQTIARRPIWEFIYVGQHAGQSLYAIRNETTGCYLTTAGNGLTLSPRVGPTQPVAIPYHTTQLWRVSLTLDGEFRIGSASNHSLYITEAADIIPGNNNFNVTLSASSIALPRQRWHIGPIWHSYRPYVGFWEGPINIRTETLGPVPPGFNFTSAMRTARDVWSEALDVTFNTVYTDQDANIWAVAGTRREVFDLLGVYMPVGTLGLADFRHVQRTRVGFIRAQGLSGGVYRYSGVGGHGGSAVRIAAFSDHRLAVSHSTLIAIHELGHALGYRGHSLNESDIMYEAPTELNNRATLNPAERAHLRQIYTRFRRR